MSPPIRTVGFSQAVTTINFLVSARRQKTLYPNHSLPALSGHTGIERELAKTLGSFFLLLHILGKTDETDNSAKLSDGWLLPWSSLTVFLVPKRVTHALPCDKVTHSWSVQPLPWRRCPPPRLVQHLLHDASELPWLLGIDSPCEQHPLSLGQRRWAQEEFSVLSAKGPWCQETSPWDFL
jgi:hypothetical protein